VSNNQQAEFGTGPSHRRGRRQNVAQLLFLRFLHSEGKQVSLVIVSHTPPTPTVAPPPCLPLYIKDLLKEDELEIDWLTFCERQKLLGGSGCTAFKAAAIVCLQV
jgi:hypothetical protein